MRSALSVVRPVGVALPGGELPAADAVELPLGGVGPGRADAFRRLVERSGIERRRVALPPAELVALGGASRRAPVFERIAVELGERAARDALGRSGIAPGAIRAVVSASCTGYMLPSLDAALVERLGLDPGVRRVPITELGCSAGVATLAIGTGLRAATGGAALVVCVEPCSLCAQTGEVEPSDVVGNALFGDAAAAVVLVSPGEDGDTGPAVLAVGSATWPAHGGLLGMRLTDTGPRLVLSPRLPGVLRELVPPAVDGFLAGHGLARGALDFWVIHPGGPRILEAIGLGLGLGEGVLAPIWEVWRRVGNVSSATVFLVLEELAARRPPLPGSLGLMLAVGPGLSLEMVLVRAGGWLCGRG